MKLLTKEIEKKLPPLHSTSEENDPVAIVKFFDPVGSWTWYATEFDGEDTFFGRTDGHFSELGYFSLNELKNHKGHFGLGIERDTSFTPTPLSKLPEKLNL